MERYPTTHRIYRSYYITPGRCSALPRWGEIQLYSARDAESMGRLSKRGRGFGPEVTRRVMLGTTLSVRAITAYYLRPEAGHVKRGFDEVKKYDLLVAPTPDVAFKVGRR